jgi:DNA modification methylase
MSDILEANHTHANIEMDFSKPLHPFPARMAPEIALRSIDKLSAQSIVLDPMVGSGTVARAALDKGHHAIGFDMDPLAILMSKVWTTPTDTDILRKKAKEVVEKAESLAASEISLPWIDAEPETQKFIDFWFAPKQKLALGKLATILNRRRPASISNALKLGVSKIIVTKSRGASLAGDVSHSRPHKIRMENDFDVFTEYLKSVEAIAKRLDSEPPLIAAEIFRGDARKLNRIESATIDAILTSPPYLNAIDYLRGHRLALVWLGFSISELRKVRSNSVGAEKVPNQNANKKLAIEIVQHMPNFELLPLRTQKMITRYALDVYGFLREAYRVLKSGGEAVYVVGNSCLKGIYIENTNILIAAAKLLGFNLVETFEREIPESRRYLPPPKGDDKTVMNARMRTEAVIVLSKPN